MPAASAYTQPPARCRHSARDARRGDSSRLQPRSRHVRLPHRPHHQPDLHQETSRRAEREQRELRVRRSGNH